MCEKIFKKRWPAKEIDHCMRDDIEYFNSLGIRTIGSCCGHGKYRKTIIIRHIGDKVSEHYSGVELKPYNPKIKKRYHKYYKRDKEGYYYIPEVEKFWEEANKRYPPTE